MFFFIIDSIFIIKIIMGITNTYEYKKLRGLKQKLELINKKGGCCMICGYANNLAALEFHHRDPSQKEYQLGVRKISNSSIIDLMVELDKCDLLCSNCHKETHYKDLEFSKVELLIESVDNSVLEIKKYEKPKCIDCKCEVNYGSERCTNCNNFHKRKVVRPCLGDLINELKIHSQEWCAKKYGVSRSTIKRWLKKYN